MENQELMIRVQDVKNSTAWARSAAVRCAATCKAGGPASAARKTPIP